MSVPSFEWKPRYSVGNAKLDAEHQELLGIMDTLEQAVEKGDTQQSTATIEALLEYSLRHFAFEEELMAKHQYDGFEMHKRQHDRFQELCLGLRGTEPSPELAIKILDTLREWLSAHILELDKDLGRYLL